MELLINNEVLSVSSRRKTKEENGEILFYCSHCNKYLSLDNFERQWNNSHTKKNRVRSECKKCRTEESRLYHFYRRRRYTDKVAKERMIHLDKFKHDFIYHNQMVLLRHATQHAKKLNIPCTIKHSDIIIPDKCPLLDVPFILNDKKYTYSIDRIDNSKGYVPGNIAVISRLANMMKNCANFIELTTFSRNINSYIKKQSELHE